MADSATSVNNTSHRTGVINARDESHAIVMGDGYELSTEVMGDIKATVCDCQGNQKLTVKLTDVVVNPDGHFSLFSTSKLQKEGWVLGGNKDAMWLSKDGATIQFDILVSTPKANLYCAYLKHQLEVSSVGKGSECLTVNQAHGHLGHMNEDRTHQVAKVLGWTLKPGPFQVCQACVESKAKQKNLPSNTEHIKASKEEPRIHLDISTIKDSSGSELSKSNWHIMVDERTGMNFSDFFSKNLDMVKPTCKKINLWKQAGLCPKYIRLDNAGENKKLGLMRIGHLHRECRLMTCSKQAYLLGKTSMPPQ